MFKSPADQNSEHLISTPDSYRRYMDPVVDFSGKIISKFINRYTNPSIRPQILSFGSYNHADFTKRFLDLVKSKKYEDLKAIKSFDKSEDGSFINMVLLGNINTPLTSAIEEENHILVANLISFGADINTPRSDGEYPLTLAVKTNNKIIVGALLSRGANTEVLDFNGKTPLWIAMENKNHDLARILIFNGAKTNCKNAYDESLLSFLASKGYGDMLEIAIDHRSNINQVDIFGDNPLLLAVKGGHKDVVEILLRIKGIDVDLSDKSYLTPLSECKFADTPLIIAIKESHKEIAQILLNSGADPNKSNEEGQTPLMFAIKSGDLQMVKLLVKKNVNHYKINSNSDSSLTIAAQIDNLDIVKFLLKERVDVSVVNNDGDNALTIAARNCRRSICEILLLNGLDINHQNKLGENALMMSASRGKFNTVQLLLSNHSLTDLVNNFGDSALMIAARFGSYEIVKMLIDAGSDPHKVNKYGDNGLMIAARIGHQDIFDLMCKQGVDFGQKNCFNKDVLIIAAQRGDLRMVVFLLCVGIDLRRGNNGITAYKLAYSRGHDQVAEVLRDRLQLYPNQHMVEYFPKTKVSLFRNDARDILINDSPVRSNLSPQLNFINLECKFAELSENDDESLISSNPSTPKNAKRILFQDSPASLKSIYSDILISDELGQQIVDGNLRSLKNMLEDHQFTSDDLSSALLLAALLGKSSKISLLLEHGADINYSHQNGNTAIILATIHGNVKVVKELIKIEKEIIERVESGRFGGILLWDNVAKIYSDQKPTVINQVNHEKNNSLIIAAKKGDAEIIEVLLQEPSCKIDQPNRYGNTALTIAVQENRPDIVKMLLDKGANINHKNISYETAMDIAKKKPINQKMIEVLEGFTKIKLRDFYKLSSVSLVTSI